VLMNLVKDETSGEDEWGLSDLSTHTLKRIWRKGMIEGQLSREGVPSWCFVG